MADYPKLNYNLTNHISPMNDISPANDKTTNSRRQTT